MLYEFKNFLYSLHNATICKGYKYENNMTLITCSRYHMSICLHVTRYMTTWHSKGFLVFCVWGNRRRTQKTKNCRGSLSVIKVSQNYQHFPLLSNMLSPSLSISPSPSPSPPPSPPPSSLNLQQLLLPLQADYLLRSHLVLQHYCFQSGIPRTTQQRAAHHEEHKDFWRLEPSRTYWSDLRETWRAGRSRVAQAV